jgi:hypothetical protein
VQDHDRRPPPGADRAEVLGVDVLFSGSGVTTGDGNRTAATVYPSVVRSGSISNEKSAAASRNRSGTDASAAVGGRHLTALDRTRGRECDQISP